MLNMIKGSCLCQAVKYTITEEIGMITHCHCQECRKAHAAAFATVTRVNVNAFELISGENQLTAYESSPGKKRYFCSKCGAQIYSHKDGQDFHVVRLGTLDSDIGEKPARHIFVGDKASWYNIETPLPQFKQWPQDK
jgi:hypothetical protein